MKYSAAMSLNAILGCCVVTIVEVGATGLTAVATSVILLLAFAPATRNCRCLTTSGCLSAVESRPRRSASVVTESVRPRWLCWLAKILDLKPKRILRGELVVGISRGNRPWLAAVRPRVAAQRILEPPLKGPLESPNVGPESIALQKRAG
jgi:hypothetical protein